MYIYRYIYMLQVDMTYISLFIYNEPKIPEFVCLQKNYILKMILHNLDFGIQIAFEMLETSLN